MLNKIEYRKKYYSENKEREKLTTQNWRERNKENRKLVWDKWYKKNKESIVQKRKRPDIMLKRSINSKGYRKKYPEKIIARNQTQHIKIPKNHKCEICKDKLAIHKHHKDYSQPTKLLFLCMECHTKITYEV